MSYKKKLCVYMSFNIKRHIYTSVISWCSNTFEISVSRTRSRWGRVGCCRHRVHVKWSCYDFCVNQRTRTPWRSKNVTADLHLPLNDCWIFQKLLVGHGTKTWTWTDVVRGSILTHIFITDSVRGLFQTQRPAPARPAIQNLVQKRLAYATSEQVSTSNCMARPGLPLEMKLELVSRWCFHSSWHILAALAYLLVDTVTVTSLSVHTSHSSMRLPCLFETVSTNLNKLNFASERVTWSCKHSGRCQGGRVRTMKEKKRDEQDVLLSQSPPQSTTVTRPPPYLNWRFLKHRSPIFIAFRPKASLVAFRRLWGRHPTYYCSWCVSRTEIMSSYFLNVVRVYLLVVSNLLLAENLDTTNLNARACRACVLACAGTGTRKTKTKFWKNCRKTRSICEGKIGGNYLVKKRHSVHSNCSQWRMQRIEPT